MKRNLMGIMTVFTAALMIFSVSGCGSSAGKSEKTAPVQNVGELCGISTELDADRFTGVVTSGKEKTVARDADRKIGEVYVKKGDDVAEGQILFIYDATSTNNDLEKAQLELQQMQNTLSAKQAERAQLVQDKKKAKDSEQLNYTLQIAEADTDIREQQYNIGLKEKDIEKLKNLLINLDVKAPFAGRVESVGSVDGSGTGADGNLTTADIDTMSAEDGSDDSTGSSGGTGFIKIVETDQVRVKGTVNEMQMSSVFKDMPVVIRSRVDDAKTWKGTVESVETGSPESDSNASMYAGGGDTSNQSSKYAFYVSLPEHEGLMIGQHVYIEQDMGQTESASAEIKLAASFINDVDQNPWVWAEDSKGLLEKRSITTGNYDSADDTWVVTGGIKADDFIAYPDDSYTVGMPCTEEKETPEADSSAAYMEGDVMSGAAMGEGIDGGDVMSGAAMGEGVDLPADNGAAAAEAETADGTDGTVG